MRLCEGARAEGVLVDALLERCTIHPQYGDDRDCVSPAQYMLLCMDTAVSIEDGIQGLGLSRMKIGYSGLTVRAMLGSSSLEDAINAAATLYRIAVPAVRLELRTDQDYARLVLRCESRTDDAAVLLEDIQLSWLYSCCSHFLGRLLPLVDLTTRDPRPMSLSHLHWGGRIAVLHGTVAGFRFSRSLLSARCVGKAGDSPHWECMRRSLQFLEQASPAASTMTLDAKVQALRLKDLARKAAVSTSTLRRRLDDGVTGFRQMRQRTLVDAGIELLRTTDEAVEEIAERLGYSDARSFRRFLKGATGRTPQEIRSAGAIEACNAVAHDRIRDICLAVDRC
jgi:AraC-like DNA-binding protein